MRKRKFFLFLCFFGLISLFCLYSKTGNRIWKSIPSQAGATVVGDAVCLSCHEDIHEELVKAFKFTAHRALEKTGQGCESCHGPGSLHSEDGDPEKIAGAGLASSLMSDICLSCHNQRNTMQWKGSGHDMSDVSCIDCHKVHQAKSVVDAREHKIPSSPWVRRGSHAKSLKAPEPDLCYSCHSRQKAKMRLASHHPVFEGKMICTSCHEVHGGDGMLKNKGRSINDLCTRCHSRHQGPFAFEHEAVVENCMVCHEPHGTIVNNLLKKTEPFLCYQCHSIHTSIRVHRDVQKVAGVRCTYCHPHIHGSNLSPHLGAR